jgi:WD40 repeat protein
MAALFVSHSSADQTATSQVCERLRAEGIAALFVDFDPAQGIPAGRNWERELYAQVRKADAVVFLSSPASVASHWCFAEVALARLLRKPVFPMVIEAGARHRLLGDTQHIDLAHNWEAGFTRLWDGLRRAGLDPRASFAWDPARPPYPGLESFAEEDAAVFFGREQDTERLLELLQPGLQGRGRFIAVVGPSGSGKSSLVRAGLLPRLALLPHHWLVVPRLVPGNQPSRQLARSLAKAFKDRGAHERPARLARRLAGSNPALVELVEELRDTGTGEPPSVLLVVDQAEELATLCGPAQRASFLDLLHGAVHTAPGVWVLVTVRAEFLEPLLQQPGVGKLVDETLLVSPLGRSQLFAVIEGPAARAGLQFAPGLVGRLVEDTQGGDALPLLAFALRQLADRAGQDGEITTEAYVASGGVVGALQVQADQTKAKLISRGHAGLVVPTLTNLATVAGDSEPTRRRVARNTLSLAEDQIIQAFVDARLLVTDRDEQGRAVVEVAHEALLRQWPPLRQAIEARRDDLRMRAELERLAYDWDRAGRRDDYLLRGERLEAARRWADSHADVLASLPLVQEFLDHSARQDVATLQRESELLANRVLAGFEDDPELGILLGMAAIQEYAASPRAGLALGVALAASHVRAVLRGHWDSIEAVAFSPDGSRLLTASWDGTARIWNAATGKDLLTQSPPEDLFVLQLYCAAFSPDGTRVVTGGNEKNTRIWNAATGEEVLTLRGTGGPVKNVAWSPDGTRLATDTSDGTARIWDTVTGEELLTLYTDEGYPWGIAWFPDGTRIVTGGRDRTVRIWDAATGEVLLTMRGEDYVQKVALSPDGGRVVTAGSGRTARIWDASTGEELLALRSHTETVNDAAFSPDGRFVVTASNDRTARIWDAATGEELLALRGHRDRVNDVAFSPDGRRVATASGDRTVRIWDAAPSSELRGHKQPVTSVAFSPDGSRVLTASWDATARIWDTATGKEQLTLHGHTTTIGDVAWSHDGTRVATASEDNTARIWDALTGEELFTLSEHGDMVISVAWSPDGAHLVTVAANENIARVWNLAARAKPRIVRRLEDVQDGVAWSPDSTRIAIASDDSIKTWAVATSAKPHVLCEFRNLASSIAWSQDGTRIAATLISLDPDDFDEPTVRVWDTATGHELLVLRVSSDGESSVAWSPDSTRIITTSYNDRAARIWDVATGEELLALRGHRDQVDDATFSPDGTRVATASKDHTARIWDATTDIESLMDLARDRLFRELTEDERRSFRLPHGRA